MLTMKNKNKILLYFSIHYNFNLAKKYLITIKKISFFIQKKQKIDLNQALSFNKLIKLHKKNINV